MVPSSWTRTIIDALLVAGVDVFKVLPAAGFSVEDFRDPHATLPAEASRRLWTLAVQRTGDPAFGLEVSRHVNQTTFPGLGVAVLASATVHDAMQRLVRYHRLVCDGGALTLQLDHDGACLRMQPGEDVCTEASDALLSLIVRVCRLVTQGAFTLRQVAFRRAAPDVLWRYQQTYRCPMRFAAHEDALYFDAAQLALPLTMANPELAQRSDETARLFLERIVDDGVVLQVRSKLAARLADKPTAQRIARALGMSQRSMQRRLNEAGTSFEVLLGELRKEQACAQLRDGHRNVAELAFTLGFDDASAFARAFRRWTGHSPSAYRALSTS